MPSPVDVVRWFGAVQAQEQHPDGDLGADRRGVVVAPDAHRAELGQAANDAVRIGPVADDVPELTDGVHRTEMGEHGVKGDEIAMDVRKDSDPHRGEG